MPHITLGLERAQYCQNSRVCEFVAQPSANLRDYRGTMVPEQLHNICFAVGECNVHEKSLTRCIVDSNIAQRLVDYDSSSSNKSKVVAKCSGRRVPRTMIATCFPIVGHSRVNS